MSYQSSNSKMFLSTVKSWIEQEPEILVMIRFSHAAGTKSFEFFSDYDAFVKKLDGLESKTCLIVFREPQLPLRGIVDESFIERAKQLVPDGQEYLLTGLVLTEAGDRSWYHNCDGQTHQELEEDLRDCFGEQIAFGIYPPWMHDEKNVISAVIPEPDGSVVCGVY